MPRKPNIPCAACGRLLWGGRGSLPAGQATCQPCRRLNPAGKGRVETCRGCKAIFTVRGYQQTYCSVACAALHKPYRLISCPCGAPAVLRGRFCDPCRVQRRRDYSRMKNHVRRAAAPAPAHRMTMTELGDRDGWRCHLCRRRVNSKLKSPHSMSPTMDHLIPASDHDTSHEPVNLALAHRICNIRRSNRGPAQLALIG